MCPRLPQQRGDTGNTLPYMRHKKSHHTVGRLLLEIFSRSSNKASLQQRLVGSPCGVTYHFRPKSLQIVVQAEVVTHTSPGNHRTQNDTHKNTGPVHRGKWTQQIPNNLEAKPGQARPGQDRTTLHCRYALTARSLLPSAPSPISTCTKALCPFPAASVSGVPLFCNHCTCRRKPVSDGLIAAGTDVGTCTCPPELK
jgi:hypothetical protein